VRDLLGDTIAWGVETTACTDDADCSIESESCVAQMCQPDPCAVHTFVFPADGQSYGTVHVAGTFNGWPGTIADGGWPMTYVPSIDAWIAKHSIDDGPHSYKLVLDETTWITDPNGEGTEDDGFGGLNSTLQVACEGVSDPPAASPLDPTSDFPVESRPQGYPFDNAAEAGLVTATHVERYLRTAEAIAERTDLSELTGCDLDDADDACLRSWIEGFGRRVFRRPLEPDHVDAYLALTTSQESTRLGIEVALRVMLSSPMFLYRQEIGVVGDDGFAHLDGWEVAASLSYFLWGSTPDDALLDAAESGALDEPSGIAEQARRLLDSDRARKRLGVFGAQWLGVERIVTADKNADAFPEFDRALAADMLEETKQFIASVIVDGGSYPELLLSGHTVASPELQSLYGAEDGELPDARHAGLLGHASVLGSHSHSDQTSPVRRGVFVRERILCAPLPPPPPDAATIPSIDPNASTRERFSQHSSDPACEGCHRLIDPVGFAFEHFDAIGRYRETEGGIPIDASGSVYDLDGEDPSHDGLVGLAGLIADSEQGPACFATQSYRFALGALETEAEACDLDRLATRFAEADYDLRELLVAVTQLESFTRRRTE
jgi:hypothetical protein